MVERFLAVFYPAAEFLVTTRITRVEGEAVQERRQGADQAGWLAVYGKEVPDEEDAAISCRSHPNEKVAAAARRRGGRHPDQAAGAFTEATLLSAMEGAGKLVEDEELREAMSEKGLGTPATRASIIERLICERIHRTAMAASSQPTAKAFSLITLLRGSRFRS